MFRRILIYLLFYFNFTSLIAAENCSEERKQWIEHLKEEVGSSFNKPVYSDNKCIVELIAYDGISIEQHSYRLAGEKRDSFKDITIRDDQEGLYNLLSDIKPIDDINWVPSDFKPNSHPDYVDGLNYFNNQKYDEAALFFGDFLENNFEHQLAPEVQFKYAEIFRFREDYIEAASQYLTGYEKFIESEFTPLYVMRLGEMMIKIDFPKTGCELLNNVQNEVPPVNDDIYLETEQLMKTYKCPKVVTTDGDIMLANLIKNTKELIQ